ncbi:MAG TPA: BlaI/MecI/CopY family transcriptional regulator [Pirellulaceae bacterium]|nr:BlaI/MecI/CopY family transcriptional regulator [Pirellulaceae bacterium]
MSRKLPADLSRRERQIMEIIYVRGEASAAQVLEQLPDPPSYSAVRALLSILVQKGQLKHRAEQGRYVYAPTRRRARAGRSALVRVLETFYEGSLEKAVAALLTPDSKLSADELKRLSELIEQARKEGR